jgi:hypothetical protein
VTGVLAVACFLSGAITGSLVTSIFVMEQISRSQELMQTKVRYWQSETLYARRQADRFARALTALEWPVDDTSGDSPHDELWCEQ